MEILRRRFPEIALAWSVASFFALLLELILVGHVEGLQLVGLFAALAGMLAAIAGFASAPVRRAGLLALALVAAAGVVGALVHWQEGAEERAAYAYGYDEGEDEGAPPPLAPLGLSGTALLAGLAILARDPEPPTPEVGFTPR